MDVLNASELGESFDRQSAKRHLFLSMGTLSNDPSSIIASVGFIVADPRSEGPPDAHYFKTVDWDQAGRKYNFNTIQTWLGRSAMARKSLVNHTPPVQVADALRAVAEAYKKHGCVAVWGGAEDLAILRNAFEHYKVDCPWPVTDQRDILSVWSTMEDLGLAPVLERDVTEPPHVALGDAAFIARGVALIYRGFRGDKPPGDRVLTTSEAREVTHDGNV